MEDIVFRTITLEDKEVIDFFLHKDASLHLAAFTFSTLVSWGNLYHYTWAVADDTLLMKLTTLEDGLDHLMQPFGAFPEILQDKIIRLATSLNYKLTIFGVSNEFIEKHPEFVSHFNQTELREFDNYIYSSESLALLNGREYQSKRNLINQFEKNNQWTSEAISAVNISDCLEIISKIYNQDELNTDFYLGHELNALDFVLHHFPQLKGEGVLIRVEGKPVAFSIYEKLNASTYVVHFEKAIKDYKGLYQLVNRETAKNIMAKGFKYINREEDLGIEGLRKSKLSYHPLELSPAHALIYK